MNAIFQNAWNDIGRALQMRRVWVALASEDIGDQHRRTTLGPIWLLLNYLAFAGTFIFVFRGGSGGPGYAAYAATGLLVWFYIMETVIQGITLFVREENFIKGTVLPISVYVMRQTMQSVIRAAYALLGCIAVVLLSGTSVSFGWIFALLGLLLIVLTTPAVVTCVAFLGAYFPDSQFIIQNLMRIGMFLTPVFWTYDGSGGIQHAFYWWNPFTYFLDIVREPILSGTFPATSFLFCLSVAVVLWILGMYLLGRFRKHVVFVL